MLLRTSQRKIPLTTNYTSLTFKYFFIIPCKAAFHLTTSLMFTFTAHIQRTHYAGTTRLPESTAR